MDTDFEILVRIFMSGIALLAGTLICVADDALGCLVVGFSGAHFLSAAIELSKTKEVEYRGTR